MHVSYAGRPFEILNTTGWLIEEVRVEEQAPPLYYHWQMDFTCWLNPDATAAQKFAPTGPAPFCATPRDPFGQGGGGDFGGLQNEQHRQGKASPVETLIEVLKRLAQPRQKLLVWLDSGLPLEKGDPREVILESPLPGMQSDCLNGPRCRLLGPIPDGNASIVLHLRFETWMPLCSETNAPFLLSNYFTIAEDYDEQYRPVRIISGEARFRLDCSVSCATRPICSGKCTCRACRRVGSGRHPSGSHFCHRVMRSSTWSVMSSSF